MTATSGSLAIDFVELQAHIEQLGEIGKHPEAGLYRALYSESWVAAMALVERWLGEAGLETRRDAVGNLFGRLAGTASARVVLSGSHIDTVKQGGRYDGALGIHAAIAAVKALRQAHGRPKKTLEVLVICEEEGSRYPNNFWGARAICDQVQPDEAERFRDADGVTLAAAMRGAGFDPARIGEAKRDDLDAFLELHIEQGRILESEGYPLGIVNTITGQRHLRVTVSGRQDHAGTTPMDLRTDPMAGAAEMIHRVTRLAAELGRPAVATVGTISASPGAVNIVPGRVTFTIDSRSPLPDQLAELLARIDAILEEVAARRGLGLERELLNRHQPVPLDEGLRSLLKEVASGQGLATLDMPSGAGHDSEILAERVPTAMIFVPSQDGKSHRPDEYTPLEQIEPGVRVLAEALYRLAYV
jgi:allantoate deiminase